MFLSKTGRIVVLWATVIGIAFVSVGKVFVQPFIVDYLQRRPPTGAYEGLEKILLALASAVLAVLQSEYTLYLMLLSVGFLCGIYWDKFARWRNGETLTRMRNLGCEMENLRDHLERLTQNVSYSWPRSALNPIAPKAFSLNQKAKELGLWFPVEAFDYHGGDKFLLRYLRFTEVFLQNGQYKQAKNSCLTSKKLWADHKSQNLPF